MPQMQADELKAILQAEISQSLGYQSDELASDREDAWKGYLAEPYGNEIEGQSKVVSTDIMDTIEWIMPQLMRIFEGSEYAVEFIPHGPEDEEAAKQATDYCNYVWGTDNNGFLNSYTAFKDCLIAKLGVLKIYWESREDWKRETYRNLDEDTYGLIAADPEMEIIEHTDNNGLHDVTVKHKKTSGKICIDPVPPDEFLFSRDTKDVETGRFVGHRTRRTLSDLIEQYPDKRTEIEDLSSDAPGTFTDQAQFRSTVGEDNTGDITAAINKAMREVWVTEGYLRVDYDGDGIAEMRKITVAGDAKLILDNEEWDGLRPFAVFSPILMPHRLVGISVADTVKDLQLVHTTLFRQYLQSLYLANNPREEVAIDRLVEPSEALISKPGVKIRRMGDIPAITPVPVNFAGDTALAGMAYIDQLRENRTGVSQRTQGLGEDTLHDTAKGQDRLLSAAQSRIELIARVLAEGGMKAAFKLILSLVSKYQDKERVIRLSNQWVPMDPRQWSSEYDMTANVGLGHGSNDQKVMALQAVIAMQNAAVQLQQGVQGPLVTAENVYNAVLDFAEASQLKSPEQYFTDPRTVPPQPPKPDPEMMKVQAEMQMKQMELQGKAQIETQQAQQDYQLKTAEMQQKAEIEKIQAQADIAVKQAELQMKREEHQMKMQQLQAKNQFDMQAEQMRIQADRERNQTELGMMKDKHKLESRMALRNARLKSRESRSKAANGRA